MTKKAQLLAYRTAAVLRCEQRTDLGVKLVKELMKLLRQAK